MFKKYGKQIFEKEVTSPKCEFSDLDLVPPVLPSNFSEQIMSYAFPEHPLQAKKEGMQGENPETIIGENVCLKGELSFQKMLRIDGTFEGELVSEGKLIVGPKGNVKAHIHLQEAFISGKIEGNIHVKGHLALHAGAEVNGDIIAATLSIETGAIINGHVQIHGATG